MRGEKTEVGLEVGQDGEEKERDGKGRRVKERGGEPKKWVYVEDLLSFNTKQNILDLVFQ